MAKAYITEFCDYPTEGVTMAKWSARTVEQTPVTFTTSTQSAAFGANVRYIMFTTDAICSWTIGSNPTATTNSFRFPADTIYHIDVQPGDKIAFVTNT